MDSDPSSSDPSASDSPNEQVQPVADKKDDVVQPSRERKTWKTPKGEGESFHERRAKRKAHWDAVADSKSKLKEDGTKWVDAHQQFTSGQEAVVDDEDANMETTWEDISFDAVREASAKQILEADFNRVSPDIREQYRQETSNQWNKFYQVNKQNFFKDRNYLDRLFSSISREGETPKEFPSAVVMEVGSGVGNSLFPLMVAHPDMYFYAFDCSAKAIELMKAQARFDAAQAHAFVCDITREDISDLDVKPASVDIATMVFMLSAVAPEQMDDVLQKINRKLKIGGHVLFRDYGIYDMTQMRFYAKKTPNKMGENFYRRSDGTFTYFFSLEVLAELFQRNGFEVVENTFDTKVLSNRKRKIRMYRVWANSKFVKVRDTPLVPQDQASSSNQS